MVIQYILLAIPLALAWVLLTDQLNPAGVLIGLLLGLISAYLVVGRYRLNLDTRQIPEKIIYLSLYTLILTRDIFLAGIDVSLRVLGVRPLRPGIIAVPTQDEQRSEVTAGLSAHGITITPGSLVVDFDGSETMYVHCLDAEAFAPVLDEQQAQRLAIFKRILGR